MNNLTVVLEQVFLCDRSGRYASLSTFDDAFWKRYLRVFDRVRIVARVKRVNDFPDGASVLAEPRVSVAEIPFYQGPFQFLLRYVEVQKALKKAVDADGFFILRLPGFLGMAVGQRLRRLRRPYAVELVGDPQEILRPGVAGSPFTRPLLRPWFVRGTRVACYGAVGVSYVSHLVLSERYPAADGAEIEYYSSINLPSERFVSESRHYQPSISPVRILTVGSLEYRAKGVDVLLRACASLNSSNVPVSLEIVGEGILRRELEELVQSLGISDAVRFAGHLPHDDVFNQMDQCDLFVLASRSEGLPRVVVEAMARGLPVVATSVGGIPELIDVEFLAPPDDAAALADLIGKVVSSPETLSSMSANNLGRASAYAASELTTRRDRFYRAILARSE
ncbi:MAG: glycosyl transferase family 1 [Parvibaculum sp.]|uniref:glycosyltransferase n=1 Tax=Parvibaculum sp. TaxID=2024848 RepID=UPI000C63C4F9|nr:glycosyltransferase [Parvibaculum sp.]MAU59426.1 glycosyl transferase family 1 [Parvibaculum sp.]|tara:strand:+ start:13043 stop:14221 length:1179 start_codon:yes stop_codon:yes gene_type:complete